MEQSKTQSNLTPVAVIIAGLIIAGAIVGKDSFYKLLDKKQASKPGAETTQTSETKTQTAVEKFKEYAKGLGLNQKDFDSCLDSGKYKSRVDETTKQANELGVSGTPSFFINGKLLVGAQQFTVFKAILDKDLRVTTDYPADIKETITKMKEAAYFSDIAKNVPVSGEDPMKGNANALVTIVEFTDYQCPYCANYVVSTLPQIQKDYITTGKIKYILKDIPLTGLGHKNAPKAAEAALCAKDQGKYWEMHDKIFSTQSEWSSL